MGEGVGLGPDQVGVGETGWRGRTKRTPDAGLCLSDGGDSKLPEPPEIIIDSRTAFLIQEMLILITFEN